jgi:hypothetical protein
MGGHFQVNGVEGLLDGLRPNTPHSIRTLWSETRSRGRRRSNPERSIYGLEHSADGGEERVYREPPSCGSGAHLDWSRIWWSASGSPKIQSSSRRCGTWGSFWQMTLVQLCCIQTLFPLSKKVMASRGILRNVGTRWDHGLRVTRRL